MLLPGASALSSSTDEHDEREDADHVDAGRLRRRVARGASVPCPRCRASTEGNAKSRILTRSERRPVAAAAAAAGSGAGTACAEAKVGDAVGVVSVESAEAAGGVGVSGSSEVSSGAAAASRSMEGAAEGAREDAVEKRCAAVDGGREERVEAAADARRLAAGEGGAGRLEVRESRWAWERCEGVRGEAAVSIVAVCVGVVGVGTGSGGVMVVVMVVVVVAGEVAPVGVVGVSALFGDAVLPLVFVTTLWVCVGVGCVGEGLPFDRCGCCCDMAAVDAVAADDASGGTSVSFRVFRGGSLTANSWELGTGGGRKEEEGEGKGEEDGRASTWTESEGLSARVQSKSGAGADAGVDRRLPFACVAILGCSPANERTNEI